MRMWMVNPIFMCDKHLLGEHCEIHMFIGSIKRYINVTGYLKNNLLEPLSLIQRHNVLVQEMVKRGMKHNSDIKDFDVHNFLTLEELHTRIDSLKSFNELITKCKKCYEKRNYYFKVV